MRTRKVARQYQVRLPLCKCGHYENRHENDGSGACPETNTPLGARYDTWCACERFKDSGRGPIMTVTEYEEA